MILRITKIFHLSYFLDNINPININRNMLEIEFKGILLRFYLFRDFQAFFTNAIIYVSFLRTYMVEINFLHELCLKRS